MPAYEYTALDVKGKKLKGVMESDSPRLVRHKLREKNWTPIAVTQTADESRSSARWRLFRSVLSSQDLAMLTRQLATLVEAGIPLAESLQAVADQSERNSVIRIVTTVRAKVLEGFSLARSLSEYPDSFNRVYRSTIDAGENSGHLDVVLFQLADHAEASDSFRKKVQLALIYPIMLLVLSFIIVTGLMVYVVPDVIEVLTSTGQPLPPLTVALTKVSKFIAEWGWLMAFLCVSVFLIFRASLRSDGVRKNVHTLMLSVPLLGRFTRKANSTQYVNTLSILLRSGVSLVDAMRIAAEVVSNEHLRSHISAARQKVIEGVSLSNALRATNCFSPIMIHMVASGETSGKLEEMLRRTAKQQQEQLQNSTAAAIAMFEPLMLLVMGGVVMLIVLAILLPILNLNQLVA